MAADTEALLRDIIAAHSGQEGAALPILHDVQEALGYVPEDAIPVIAKALNVSRAEMYGVVSFYHDFRREPAGRHVLKLCRAEACQARGSDRIASAIESALGVKFGETSSNGQVTLEAVYCLGLCAIGPSAMVDHRIMARLTDAKVAPLVEEMRR
jgi:formate dehydrogenase subunit gamma